MSVFTRAFNKLGGYDDLAGRRHHGLAARVGRGRSALAGGVAGAARAARSAAGDLTSVKAATVVPRYH